MLGMDIGVVRSVWAFQNNEALIGTDPERHGSQRIESGDSTLVGERV